MTIPTNKNIRQVTYNGTVIPLEQPNCQIITFTLSTHATGNINLGTLNSDALSHVNDTNFTVSIINTTPATTVQFDDYMICATNNDSYPKQGSYAVYGIGVRMSSATAVQVGNVYYPPKSTDNSTSLGGFGKIWHSGSTLYYISKSYYFGAGTYRIVVSW